MRLTDAGADRKAEQYQAEHVAMVEAVRIGTIIAHSKRQSAKWRSHVARNRKRAVGPGLTGAALERAVIAIAHTDPGLVKIVTKAD